MKMKSITFAFDLENNKFSVAIESEDEDGLIAVSNTSVETDVDDTDNGSPEADTKKPFGFQCE